MTLADMIEKLEEYREIYGDDCEIRLMTQQNWPFENSIYGVCCMKEVEDHKREEDEEDEDDSEDDSEEATVPVVYIVEGSQLGYGDKAAWDACR